MSFFTEDAVRLGAFGDLQQSREEIEAAYERLLHSTIPGATMKQEEGTVRILSAEFALWQGGIEIFPSGSGAAFKGHVLEVMKIVRGWRLILEAHPKFFPSPR